MKVKQTFNTETAIGFGIAVIYYKANYYISTKIEIVVVFLCFEYRLEFKLKPQPEDTKGGGTNVLL